LTRDYYEVYESGEHVLYVEGVGLECDDVIGVWKVKPTTIMIQDCIYRRQTEWELKRKHGSAYGLI